MFGLLLLTVLLLFGNGFFVAAEFALVKVRSTQLDAKVSEGSRMAGLARNAVDHLDGYLSATQLGITLTSLGLGWIGEPAVSKVLEPVFHAVHLPEEYMHQVSVAIGFTLISFLHIVVGEVAPKSLAIARPVAVSMAVAAPMRVFYGIFWLPLVFLNASSNLLLRMVGVEPAGTHALAMDQDELVRVAAESAAGGQISHTQGEMVHNVFAFSTRVAREIMVPRNRIHALDLSEPLKEQIPGLVELGHSRYPVYEDTLDGVVGVLHIKDLLQEEGDVSAEQLRALARPALFVPETLAAEQVMRTMQKQRTHLAMVVDEHGGVSGIVSLEDALEELVGDIQDEYDSEPVQVESLEDGYALAGDILLEELARLLQVDAIASDADTLQGWLMEQLSRIPRAGDEVLLGSWTIRVATVEKRVVTRAEAHAHPDGEAAQGNGKHDDKSKKNGH